MLLRLEYISRLIRDINSIVCETLIKVLHREEPRLKSVGDKLLLVQFILESLNSLTVFAPRHQVAD